MLDPGSGTDAVMDVAVKDGRIAHMGTDIDLSASQRVVRADGRLIVPGLIDMHSHVAGGLRNELIDEAPGGSFLRADLAGVESGVTTLVDAGSVGAHNVAGMLNYVIPGSLTRVLLFINAGALGQFRRPEVQSRDDIDAETTIETILRRPDCIRGVKTRMVGKGLAQLGMELPRLAKEIAAASGVPLMVHVGDIETRSEWARQHIGPLLEDVLAGGDIVTHTLSHQPGALLDAQGKLAPEVWTARDKGVVFDAAFGRANFTFDSARAVLDQGLVPDTISSDITSGGRRGPLHGLSECMNKMMALGMSLEDVVLRTTASPARALGMEDEIGALRTGGAADMTLLETATGDWVYRDNFGGVFRAPDALAIAPSLTVRAGRLIPLDYGPHPWGWWPEQAE